MSQICGICQQESKYKCPNCHFLFCSVKCGNEHKNAPTGCLPKENDEKKTDEKPVVRVSDNTVPPERLALLDNSQKLKDLLKDRRIRKIISEIDNSRDPEALLVEGMKDADFQQVIQVLLETLGES